MSEDIIKRGVLIIIVGLGMALTGDYLGYKIGRKRLTAIIGIVALVTIVVFTVYELVIS
jgi:hypothetical protein